MDAVAVVVTWLACLPPNGGPGALLDAEWGSPPAAEMVFQRQQGGTLWYGLPHTPRASLRVACFVADRIEYGYQDGRLTVLLWQFDGRGEGLVEGALSRSGLPEELSVDVEGSSSHSWITLRAGGGG